MITKKYIKSRKVCQITFEVPAAELPLGVSVETLAVAGEFNDWSLNATPLEYGKPAKAWRAKLELPAGRVYEFRYVANGAIWFNDWQADGYTANPAGDDNCVLVTPPTA